jgi:hypothetical protein
MNLDEFMKEVDGAWPEGMPPRELDICVAAEDRVLLDIKGLTLQMINDRETVVIELKPINHSELSVEQLDQMAKYIKELLQTANASADDEALHAQLQEDAESDANTDKGRDSGSDAERVVADDQKEHEGNDDESEDSDSEVVATS